MKIGIMQPYLFPYLGYFQLLNIVDKFIVYDDVKYVKSGWINRNRIAMQDEWQWLTIPIKGDSDYLNISNRFLSDDYLKHNQKSLNRIKNEYKDSPHFDTIYPILANILNYENNNLFSYLLNSISMLKELLNIGTPLSISSKLEESHQTINLKGQDKVLNICLVSKAKTYFNPIGGVDLYSKEVFREKGIDLKFLQMQQINYHRQNRPYIPSLSIIDVLFFLGIDDTIKSLNKFELF